MHPRQTALTRATALLRADVVATTRDADPSLVDRNAARIAQLDIADPVQRLVDDVQQELHDTFVDIMWPACPRHRTHPLMCRDAIWQCQVEQIAVAPLGALAPSP